ncbi:MAG: hypothetical protein ACREX9_09665, partial [Gammaproteobacteria bacterium]
RRVPKRTHPRRVLNVLGVRAPRLGPALGSARGGTREAIGATPGEDLAPHIIHTVRAPDLMPESATIPRQGL